MVKYCEYCGRIRKDGETLCPCQIPASKVRPPQSGGFRFWMVIAVAAVILVGAAGWAGMRLLGGAAQPGDGSGAQTGLFGGMRTRQVDLFAGVKVRFEGTESEGVATVSNTSEDGFLSGVTFDISQGSGLYNGDRITLTARYDQLAAEEAGIVPLAEEKEYIVEGLTTYVRTPGQLDQALLDDLDRECDDIITARVMANPYEMYAHLLYEPEYNNPYSRSDCGRLFGGETKGGLSISSITREELYVACRKQIEQVDPENNFVGAIYRMDAEDSWAEGTHTMYYYVRFDSLLERDGQVTVDLLSPQKDTGRRAVSPEQLYQALLAPYLEKYTVTRLEQEPGN